MIRTKYDGKLTDSLIQAVVDAENRLNGLMSGRLGELRYSPSGAQEEPTSQPDAIVSQRPTPTEQAEAWRRNHGPDDEPEDE